MLLQLIKKHFPYGEIVNAYAYGSKVIPQKDIKPGKMTDLIFVVNDVEDFHNANKKINREHYSLIEKYINKSKYINNVGPKIYYNQNVVIENNVIKYGVISRKNFEYSLSNWDNMFICGRFHKPIVNIVQNINYDKLIEENRKRAFALIALKNKECVDKDKFYEEIIKISYIGDIRNALYLEDKEKAKKMLKGAYSLYDNMYSKYALSSSKYKLKLNKDLNFYFNRLPKLFKDKFPSNFIKKDIKERTLIINRILKINNLMSSTMNALMGLYSSPDINYILDKYRKKLSRV